MIIQRVNRTNPEKVFIIGRNDDTAAFTKGGVVCYKFDGTRDGLDMERSVTAAAVKSTLASGITDTALAAGSYGLVQCYGVRTDALMLTSGEATDSSAAVGDVMIMDTASGGLSGNTAGAVAIYYPGFVMGETMASSATSVTTTGTVFIRMM